jgi:hypothetical protein
MDEHEINELKQKIQSVLTDSQANLIEVKAIAEGAIHREAEINTYHSRIIELKTAAEGQATSLKEILNAATSIKLQIDELHSLAQDAKTIIDSINQDSNNKKNDINDYYNAFLKLKQRIDDSETGIASTLTKATEFFGQISKINTDASTTKEEVLTYKIKSEGLLNESVQLKTEIATNLTESQRLKTEIGKILDLVRDTGLANSFDQRRKRSQVSSLIALGIITLGVIISAISIYNTFLTREGQDLFNTIKNDYIKFLLRITLTAPGVFMAWFGASQYSKERYFLEQYEFKTAAALALENYTKLLKDNYTEKEKEIFDLNLELIRSVYKEPTYIKPKTSFFTRIKTTTGETETKVSG